MKRSACCWKGCSCTVRPCMASTPQPGHLPHEVFSSQHGLSATLQKARCAVHGEGQQHLISLSRGKTHLRLGCCWPLACLQHLHQRLRGHCSSQQAVLCVSYSPLNMQLCSYWWRSQMTQQSGRSQPHGNPDCGGAVHCSQHITIAALAHKYMHGALV